MYHLFHSHLAALIGGKLVLQLRFVHGELINLRFAFTAEGGAYRNQHFHHHIVHDVMSLYIHIGVVGRYSKLGEFFFHALYLV